MVIRRAHEGVMRRMLASMRMTVTLIILAMRRTPRTVIMVMRLVSTMNEMVMMKMMRGWRKCWMRVGWVQLSVDEWHLKSSRL